MRLRSPAQPQGPRPTCASSARAAGLNTVKKKLGSQNKTKKGLRALQGGVSFVYLKFAQRKKDTLDKKVVRAASRITGLAYN